jgi:hypothetical protein
MASKLKVRDFNPQTLNIKTLLAVSPVVALRGTEHAKKREGT